LLPDFIGALVYGGPKHAVNRVGGIALHIRHLMTLDIVIAMLEWPSRSRTQQCRLARSRRAGRQG